MSLSRFFIDRPVFAWVIAIVVMLAGGIAAFTLPVEQYPTIAPPAVIANGVADALRPSAVEFNRLPIKPQVIHQAIASATRAR